MKVLYLTHRFPYPPDKGERIRAFRQIEGLSRRHDVWLACLEREPIKPEARAFMERMCRSVYVTRQTRWSSLARGALGLLKGGTVTQSFHRSRRLESALTQWSDAVPFDAVIALSACMAPYAMNIRAGRRVLDLCDVDSQKWAEYTRHSRFPLHILYELESRRLAEVERTALRQFDAVVVINEREAALLREADVRDNLHVIPNGVSIPDRANPPPNKPADDKAPTVGFVGVLNYRPNVDGVRWFVEKCWSIVRSQAPNARFRIVGRSPCRAIRALADRPGVDLIGEVADVNPEWRRFDVNVAPLLIARGLQNKALEAMAYGLPVVATSAVATGLSARDGVELLVADDAGTFARRVIELLQDPAARQRLGASAREFVKTQYRWEDAHEALDRVVTGVLASNAADAEQALATSFLRGPIPENKPLSVSDGSPR